MQKILEIISSKKFRNIFFFVAFTFLMTAAISSQNFFFQKIIDNNMALKEVIAEKDIKVIDTVKTEQHKKEVAQNVEPILTQAEDEFITTSLTALKNSVLNLAWEYRCKIDKKEWKKIIRINKNTKRFF